MSGIGTKQNATCVDECQLLGPKRKLINRCLPISIWSTRPLSKLESRNTYAPVENDIRVTDDWNPVFRQKVRIYVKRPVPRRPPQIFFDPPVVSAIEQGIARDFTRKHVSRPALHGALIAVVEAAVFA